MPYKVVLLPIEVSKGDWCWNNTEGCICTHFSNEGGHPVCDFGFDIDYDRKTGYVPKNPKCKGLKETDEKAVDSLP